MGNFKLRPMEWKLNSKGHLSYIPEGLYYGYYIKESTSRVQLEMRCSRVADSDSINLDFSRLHDAKQYAYEHLMGIIKPLVQ